MNTANVYSSVWFDTFMKPISSEQTQTEVDFLGRHLPLPGYSRILDVCCGTGRHSLELAARGYQVLGIDNSQKAMEIATSQNSSSAGFRRLDMRELGSLEGKYDGVILLWQSFGYYSPAENNSILSAISQILRPGGRLVLDIYNKVFFDLHQGTVESIKNGERIVETKSIRGHRLTIDLLYTSSHLDRFDWEIFTEDEICERLAGMGMNRVLSCTGYSEQIPVQPESPRMQIVFEKTI
jgi:SAM-dependent methyltransferase